LGNAASFSIKVVLCFSSDPCEFFRVDNDANRLNQPILHIHGQDGEDLTAGADDQGGLTVDFLELNTSVLWPKRFVPRLKRATASRPIIGRSGACLIFPPPSAHPKNLPSDWKETRNRWEFFQGVRSWLLLIGFVLLRLALTLKQ